MLATKMYNICVNTAFLENIVKINTSVALNAQYIIFSNLREKRSLLVFHFRDMHWLYLSTADSKRAISTRVRVQDGLQQQYARRWSTHTGCEGPTLLTIKTTVNQTTPRLFYTTTTTTTHRPFCYISI